MRRPSPRFGHIENAAPPSGRNGATPTKTRGWSSAGERHPLHPDLFTQSFRRTVKRAGLPRIRLHDLRHTHATLALKAGIPVKVISERLGHRDPAFTLRQYAHAIPGMQAEAAGQFAALVDRSHAAGFRAGPIVSVSSERHS